MLLSGNTTDRLSAARLAGQIGTAWQMDQSSSLLIGQLANWLDGQLSVTSQRDQLVRMRARSGNVEQTIWIPAGCLRVQLRQHGILSIPEHVKHLGSIKASGVWLDHGTDYRLRPGFLQLRPHAADLIRHDGVLLVRNMASHTYELERFWSNVLGFSDYGPQAQEFYQALVACGRSTLTRMDLARLVGAATGNQYCKQQTVVRHVTLPSGQLPARVITDHQLISGQPGAMPICQAGDLLTGGDFCFDDILIWDCRDPIPDQLSELNIPRRYLAFQARSSVKISAVPQPGSVVQSGDKPRVRYPIVTDPVTEAAWWAAQDLAEDRSGYPLINYLSESSTPQLHVAQQPQNWLELIRTAWLQHGTVVTIVGSGRRLTEPERFRLREIRRAVPAWISHMIHSDDPEVADVEC